MPVRYQLDMKGHYYQWGDHGKRYYFDPRNEASRKLAKSKAIAQMQAAHLNGYMDLFWYK